MKPIHLVLSFLAMAVLLIGCTKSASTAATDAAKPAAVNQSVATANSVPTRLSLTEATAAVRAEIFRSIPSMNPSADFPLMELTTADVWDRLHAQVFAVTSGVREDQAFVIRDRRIFWLGGGLGGWGVMSMCVADLDGSGQPKLVFSYPWGSGVHRSIVAVWTGGASWIDAKPVLRDYDLSLERIDDMHVDVAYGEFLSARNFNRQGEFGKLRLSTERAKPNLEIILDPRLSPDVLSRVWK